MLPVDAHSGYPQAIFALGNLAVELCEHDAMELLATETVVEISNSIRAAMDDCNDKVCRCSESLLSYTCFGILKTLTSNLRVGRWECDPIHWTLG